MPAAPRRRAVTRPPVEIREPRRADLPALGRLGAALAAAHHAWDPARFFVVDRMADGYAWWLGRELRNRRAVVLAAFRAGRVVGYAYGRLEPRDWNLLRERCGHGIDVIVAPGARGRGVGRALVEALIARLAEKGAPRVVIEVAARNADARRIFASMGFRETMVEMAREIAAAPPRAAASARRASVAGRAPGRRSRAAKARRGGSRAGAVERAPALGRRGRQG
jgi:ribosomal protein S18 acetylase RimI-like enzyme